MNVTYESLLRDPEIRAYISRADESLKALGFTDHSYGHVAKVAELAAEILKNRGRSEHEIELVKIAAWLHDIGNVVNRVEHAQSGALMAFRLLDKRGMDPEDIATIVTAIGNHDESTAFPVNPVAAALIIADKTDVRRSRVRCSKDEFDIHDRVNYSVTDSYVNIYDDTVRLDLEIDADLGSVVEYFDIFLDRMILCRKAADALQMHFELVINGQSMM